MKKILSVAMIFLVVLSTFSIFSPQARAESMMISNPDFEQQLTYWSTSTGTATFTADSINPHGGSYCAKGVELNEGSLGRLYQDVTGAVRAGGEYKISGWIKTSNVVGFVVIALDYVASDGWTPADGYVKEIGYVSGTSDWTYYESEVFTLPPMPADATALWFLFDFNAGKGTAWWDDVSLIEVTPPPLIFNPGFEQELDGWSTSMGTATYTADPSNLRSGSYSAKGVELNEGSLGRLYQDMTGIVYAGGEYRISGWIKTQDVTGYVVIALDYVDDFGVTPADGYVKEIGYVTGTTDWTYYESAVFTLPPMPSDASAVWFLFDFNAGKGTAWWDDVSLIEVTPPPTKKPVAELSATPTTVEVWEDVFFDASASYDPDGSVVLYWFDFGDGFDSGWTSSSTYTWSYTDPGTYYAKAKVKDNDGLISDWSDPVPITVTPVKQKPVAELSASPTTVDVQEDVTFDASASYDPDIAYPLSYWFDFGDGFDSGWTSSSTYVWSYTEYGEYYAKVRVKDNDGLISDWSDPVKITVAHLQLIEQYFPYLIFDEGEEYFPTDFYYDDENIDDNPSDYDASWPNTAYVHTVQGYWQEKEYLVIEYWFYYVRDDKLWGQEFPWIGAHDHDWESIYLFLEKEGGSYVPSKIAYFKHKYLVGLSLEDYYNIYSWEPPFLISPPFEKKDETRPIVHVAVDSHGSYERSFLGLGWPLYYAPYGDPPGIPYPEPVDGGEEMDYDDFDIIFVSTPEPSWPSEKFGDVDAPWHRSRWNDPWYLLIPRPIKNSLSVVVGSPVNILTVDPEGRRVGYDPETGAVVSEIPGATYSGPGSEPQLITIPDPLDGNYVVLLIGTATGTYSSIIELMTSEGPMTQTYAGDIVEGDILESVATVSEHEMSSTPPLPAVSIEKIFKPNAVSAKRRGAVMSRTNITNTGYLDIDEITYEDEILNGWTLKDFDHTISVTLFIDNVKYKIPYEELTYVAVEDGTYVVYINFTEGVDLYQYDPELGEEVYAMTIYTFEPGWVLEIKYPMFPPTGLQAGDYDAMVSVTITSPQGVALTVDDTATLRVR